MKRLIGFTLFAALTAAASGCCSSGCSYRREEAYRPACQCAPSYGVTAMYGNSYNNCGNPCDSPAYGNTGCNACGSGACNTGSYYNEPAGSTIVVPTPAMPTPAIAPGIVVPPGTTVLPGPGASVPTFAPRR